MEPKDHKVYILIEYCSSGEDDYSYDIIGLFRKKENAENKKKELIKKNKMADWVFDIKEYFIDD